MNPIELFGLIFLGLFSQNPSLYQSKIDTYTLSEYSFTLPFAENCEEIKITRAFATYHTGVDFVSSAEDCDITSIESGIVKKAEWGDLGQGYYVEVEHENGYSTRYFHGNGNYYVKEGDLVEKGGLLMRMGCTGHCTGRHLHLVILKDGEPLDPLNYPQSRLLKY